MSITLTLVADNADELRLMLMGLMPQQVALAYAPPSEAKDTLPAVDPFEDAPAAPAPAATPARGRGRPPKAAATASKANGSVPPIEDDVLGDGAAQTAPAPAAPARDPAADLKTALDLLRALYNRRAAQTLVTGLLGKYSVKKFSEIGPDKGSELLMDARALDAETTPAAAA
jgi:hypothetical protein